MSGGRGYSPQSTSDLSATYDDMMENLRVRYAITCQSSTNFDPKSPRTVRIELVDPKQAVRYRSWMRKAAQFVPKVVVQDSYIPRTTATQ